MVNVTEKEEPIVERHILTRFKPTFERMEKLPTFDLNDAPSMLPWRQELQKLEVTSEGLIDQMINAENERAIKKKRKIPYRSWEDRWYEYFVKCLLFQFTDILALKNVGKQSDTILTEVWAASKKASDPDVGRKLMNRIMSYHNLILGASFKSKVGSFSILSKVGLNLVRMCLSTIGSSFSVTFTILGFRSII